MCVNRWRARSNGRTIGAWKLVVTCSIVETDSVAEYGFRAEHQPTPSRSHSEQPFSGQPHVGWVVHWLLARSHISTSTALGKWSQSRSCYWLQWARFWWCSATQCIAHRFGAHLSRYLSRARKDCHRRTRPNSRASVCLFIRLVSPTVHPLDACRACTWANPHMYSISILTTILVHVLPISFYISLLFPYCAHVISMWICVCGDMHVNTLIAVDNSQLFHIIYSPFFTIGAQ